MTRTMHDLTLLGIDTLSPLIADLDHQYYQNVTTTKETIA